MNRVLFAGGGTAGHIEPAWAVSQIWKSRFPGDEIAFLGTKSGQEVELIPERGGTLFLIPKVVAPRKLNISSLLFPFNFAVSIFKTIQIVKRFDVVVGFGGYVSASAYLAAVITNKPIVLHDQNAKVGLANRLGAKFAREILLAYPGSSESKNNFSRAIRKGKIVGNPLKAEIIEAAKTAKQDWKRARLEAKSALKIDGPLVLVLGGSSGSTAINEVIFKTNFEKFDNCSVLHSVGRANFLQGKLPNTKPNYRAFDYIEDMATVLLASDLVISRSGAIATAEFAALGRYALFIPLPIGNGEQALNAQELVSAKKAEIIDQKQFTSMWLEQNLSRLLSQGSDEAYGTILNSAELIADAIRRTLDDSVKSKVEGQSK